MSKKKLDFRIDEYVVYPAHGVGKVTALMSKKLRASPLSYSLWLLIKIR